MQQKTVTVVIDEKGNSSIDLEGFAGQGCQKALMDFQGDDVPKLHRKKAEYYSQASETRLRTSR